MPLLLVVALAGCGGSPSKSATPTALCESSCASNQVCDLDESCVCATGFLDCDGVAANGCEVEGETCEVPEPPCEPEPDRAICEQLHAACGEVVVTDNCLDSRTVRCGTCPTGLVCDATSQCAEPPLQAYEVCTHNGTSLGTCDTGLRCVGSRSLDRSFCVPICRATRDCHGGQICTHFDSTGTGLCADGREVGESCVPWWEGPSLCNDTGSDRLLCLEGRCQLPCNYLKDDGTVFQCPDGQICDYASREYPEFPGTNLSRCVELPAADPCRELPAGGRCNSYQSFESCVEEGEAPTVVETKCSASHHCVNGDSGASCEPIGSGCVFGQSYCYSDTTLAVCVMDGSWEDVACGPQTECRDSPTGASCVATTPTTTIHGTLLYERVDPNDSLTDWAPPSEQPATGLYALSMRDDRVIDSASVADDGSFSLRVPADSDPTMDRIVFIAQGTVVGKSGFSFSVADPGVSSGLYSIREQRGWSPKTWMWSVGLPEASGLTFVIRESHGSAAIQIFQVIRAGMRRNAAAYGPNTPSVVVWYGAGVEWDCGACFFDSPSYGMNAQIFLDGGPDQRWAADSTTGHELGHFTMAKHGFAPREGGMHCVFNASLPGMAWSEGFASWYGADLLRNGVIASKQRGTFFFIDLDGELPNPKVPLSPDPALGLLQRLDELWIASSMRRIALDGETSAPLWRALASPRMTKRPFARGYFRHQFSDFDSSCDPINPTPTSESTPIFADFLDALVCDGVPPELIDSVVLPHYPYPSDEPLCRGNP